MSFHSLPSIKKLGATLRVPSIISLYYTIIFFQGNIFSLYCISSYGWKRPEDFEVHHRILEFGSHCLFIKNCDIFLKLMEAKLKELSVQYHHNFVEYYDSKAVNRKISVFEKPLEFEFQKEFRFYVDREANDPFVFSIGSLQEISEIRTAKEIVETLKLTRNIS